MESGFELLPVGHPATAHGVVDEPTQLRPRQVVAGSVEGGSTVEDLGGGLLKV